MNRLLPLAASMLVCVAPALLAEAGAQEKKPDAKPKEIDKATVEAWQKAGFKAGWVAVADISKQNPTGAPLSLLSFYDADYFAKNALEVPAGAVPGFLATELKSVAQLPKAALPPVRVPFGLHLGNHHPWESAGRVLEELPALGNITHLSLSGSTASNADLEALAELKGLTHLDLSYAHQVTGVGLKHLAGLKGLTYLNLDGIRFPDYWFKHLTGLENLTAFRWEGIPVSDEGLKHLAGLKKLAHLAVSGSDDPSPRLTDEGLKHLADLTELTTLHLPRKSGVTAEGAKHLAGLRKLTTVTGIPKATKP